MNGLELLWSFEHVKLKLELWRPSEAHNNGVGLYIHKNTTQSQLDGIVVSVVGSIWLPIPPGNVFDLPGDENGWHEVHKLS